MIFHENHIFLSGKLTMNSPVSIAMLYSLPEGKCPWIVLRQAPQAAGSAGVPMAPGER